MRSTISGRLAATIVLLSGATFTYAQAAATRDGDRGGSATGPRAVDSQYLTPPRELASRADDQPHEQVREQRELAGDADRDRDARKRARDRVTRTPQHGSNATGFGPLPSTGGQPGTLQ